MTCDDSDDASSDPTKEVQLLFVRHEGVIRAFVRALQPSMSDADDVMQETFLTVTQKAATFEPGTNFVGWACGIARLKVLENLRERKRATVLSESAIIALTEQGPSFEDLAESEKALEGCVEKLAPKARDILWRRYSSRESSEESGKALGMTPLAVRLALTRARTFLRDCRDISEDQPERLANMIAQAEALTASVDASADGKDYPEGRVIQYQRGTPWFTMEGYQQHYETFQRLKPEWSPPGQPKRLQKKSQP